jgi:hypothetical protein
MTGEDSSSGGIFITKLKTMYEYKNIVIQKRRPIKHGG